MDAAFDLRRFEHLARFNEITGSIEMHLRSKERQVVHVRQCGVSVTFAAGETIWTESSHKYTLSEIERLAVSAGYSVAAQWVDQEWPFAESLFRAA